MLISDSWLECWECFKTSGVLCLNRDQCRCFFHPRVLTSFGEASPTQENVFCAQLQRFQIKSMNERGLHSWHAENCYKKFPFLCKRSMSSCLFFFLPDVSMHHPDASSFCDVFLKICLHFSLTGQTCVDIKDNVVNEGYYFTPKGDDPCLSCTCHDGEPEMCVAALCERPQGCQHFRKDPKECCKFTCLDPGTSLSSCSSLTGAASHRQEVQSLVVVLKESLSLYFLNTKTF